MIPYEVIRALRSDVHVDLLTYDDGYAIPSEIRQRCSTTTFLPHRPHSDGSVSKLRNVLSASSTMTRERVTPEALRLVGTMSEQHDVTLIHGSRIAPLSKAIHGPVVIQVIDPWSAVVGMEADLTTGWRAWFRRGKSRQALHTERHLPAHARLLTVSHQDAKAWARALRRPITAIPNGFADEPRRSGLVEQPTVCFIGSLDYGPNIESVRILTKEIAPLVWDRVPAAHFILAGRNPVPEILDAAKAPGIEVQANFTSLADVIGKASVAAFPDVHGVGIRNSVREALVSGCPVIATTPAARGQDPHPLLTVRDGKHAFADAIITALVTPGTASPASGTTEAPAPATRNWCDVADDYLRECEIAVEIDRAATA